MTYPVRQFSQEATADLTRSMQGDAAETQDQDEARQRPMQIARDQSQVDAKCSILREGSQKTIY